MRLTLDTSTATGTPVTFDADRHLYFSVPDGEWLVSVTQVNRISGLLDPSRYSDLARERGTHVHQMLEWYLRGDLDEDGLDPRLRPYLDGYQQFAIEADAVPQTIEHRLGDLTRRLAGCVDWFGTVRGRPAIIDYKSGSPEEWHAIQIANYCTLAEANGLVPLARRVQRFGLYLTARGGYRLIEYTDREDFDHAEAARVVALWKVRHGYARLD